jgi:leucyl/phenylalanyl-tRNA--protein transferase
MHICGMAIYELDSYHMAFPPADHANPDGLLAIGGELREDWLLSAYAGGIFPWFNDGDPIMWWSPDPRFVLRPTDVKVKKSMRPFLNNEKYEFRLDTAFEDVIGQCSKVPRNGQNGTWITNHMKSAYIDLHKIGMAHSAEIWLEGKLIGGLYGVSIGKAFFGESMFSLKPNASKLAFIRLCDWLARRSFQIIDCQIYSKHLESLGAKHILRNEFLDILDLSMDGDSLVGKWEVAEDEKKYSL